MTVAERTGPTDLRGRITVAGLALRALRRFPRREAFAWDGGSLTYAGTLALIGRMQAALCAAGFRPRGRLALLSSNRVHAWCAATAVQALGGSVTWLHPLGAFEDHAYQLDDSQADALLVDVPTYEERGAQLAIHRPGMPVFGLGSSGLGQDLVAVAEAIGEQCPRDLSTPDDIATLGYTGGTTGRPKSVVRRQAGQAALVLATLAELELPDRPRYLAMAPISHVGGTNVLPCLMRGGTVVLARGFDADEFLYQVRVQRINMSLLVPTMIYRVLDHPALDAADLSSLELVVYGGSAIAPARLGQALERIGPVFAQVYGQSECFPISILRRGDHNVDDPELFGSCGFPASSCEIRLFDESGQETATGEPGEICVRGPQVMDGYWRQPDLTAEALVDGWLRTGDIARRDERGYLHIVDRRKDMIVTGGFNVFAREVEDVLASHPAVAQAAVIGVPDPHWGELVTALVVLQRSASAEAADLMQWVRQRKGPVHAPKRVEFVDSLPLTALGKIDKKRLRAGYWIGQARSI